MKYCPHCSRPTARVSGPCPHCGKELSADAGMTLPSTAATAAVAAPSSIPPPRASDTSSGLELDAAAYEYVPRTSRIPSGMVAPPGIDAGGLGKVGPGIWGAVTYWIRVRRRLRRLREERAAADEACVRARQARADLAAALGRTAHRLGIRSSELDRLVSLVHSLEDELKNHESRRSVRLSAHAQHLKALAAELQAVETAAAPLRETERRLVEEVRQLEFRKRGFETNRKRHQIDLENTSALLTTARQSRESSSLPEKEKFNREVAALETRHQTLTKQIIDLDASLASLAMPFQNLNAKVNTAAQALVPFTEKWAAMSAQIETEKAATAETEQTESAAVDTQMKRISLAWADAGLHVIKEHLRHPGLDTAGEAVIEAGRAVSEAESTVEMLARVEAGIDHRAVRTARNAVVIFAVVVVLAVVAILVV